MKGERKCLQGDVGIIIVSHHLTKVNNNFLEVKKMIEKDLIEMHHQYSEDGSYKSNVYRLPGSQ